VESKSKNLGGGGEWGGRGGGLCTFHKIEGQGFPGCVVGDLLFYLKCLKESIFPSPSLWSRCKGFRF
jgi:hypothetical protein